ncbi:MAG: Nin-like protein [Mesorhizobium sp.]|nr:Nin-like protein [Mesorhizobium sp. M8A.F.Ca.ET.023.01.1.1]TIW90598.1 MAG: Nin-like protein [Mesorhizobium sp.]
MMSPYLLPAGPVQIAFSGGRTSAFMLHQILQANGGLPDRVVVSFQNTGREMPQTLDFVQEVGERWNVKVVWLEYRGNKPLFEVVSHNSASRNGEPFEALIRKKQSLPDQAQKFCSAELKTLTAKRYLRSVGWKSWTSVVGFRADETHRDAYQDNRATTILPLRTAGVSKQDVLSFWAAQPFDLRLPVVRGKTVGGNCDGCFLKSEAYLSAFARDMPDRHAWWEGREKATGRAFSKRYSRADLRNYVERQGDWVLSTAGALCQKDDGECFA